MINIISGTSTSSTATSLSPSSKIVLENNASLPPLGTKLWRPSTPEDKYLNVSNKSNYNHLLDMKGENISERENVAVLLINGNVSTND